MKFRAYNVGDLVQSAIRDTSGITISLNVKKQNTGEYENVQITNSSYIRRFFTRKYNSWSLMIPEDDIPNIYFTALWNDFIVNVFNQKNWAKLYEAFTYEYNPIENYDKNSEIKTTFSGSEKNETTFTGKTKNTASNPDSGYTDTITNFRSPEDTENFTPTEKSETFIAHREDTSVSEFENRKDTQEKTFDSRIDTVTEKTHGNIGISTAMDMAKKEVDGRKFNLTDYILDTFAKENFILI